MQNFDFDNETIENIFSHPYISFMANEVELPFGNAFFFHAKMRLKSAPQKLNFAIAKAISKGYTLDLQLQMPVHVPA